MRVEGWSGLGQTTAGRRRLGDWIMLQRDRLLLSRSFQRWAARFPLTRPTARRHAAAAFDLCAGFVHSQVLLACIRLGVLDRLIDGPIAEDDLLRQLAVRPDRGRILIGAAVGLRLVSRRRGGRLGLGILGASMAANPAIAAMVEHHSMLYADLYDPVAVLNGKAAPSSLAKFWPYSANRSPADLAPEGVAAYSDLMARSQAMLVDDVLDAYPFGRHRRLLDVGGGEAAFLAAIAARHPHLELSLFDLPAVVARAADAAARQGFSRRLITHGGDFFVDPLPSGHDVITLNRIAHDHDDDRLLMLLSNIRRALAPGGVLIIAEPMSGTQDSERVVDVYFAFYLMVMGSGRPRSPADLEELLRQAGYNSFRRIGTARPMFASMIAAGA